MKVRFKVIPAVYLVLRNNDSVLLARRAGTGYMDGYYSMIAGHLDGDEPLTTALAREAEEEAGIKIDPGDLSLLHVMHTRSELKDSTEDERVDFYFTTGKFSGEPSIKEPEKCDDMNWFKLDNLPKNIVPRVKQALQQISAGRPYSDIGW